ncbi:MAG TPA: phenylalanine--tRNA ligase subunit alpha [Candidatus Norongarragalinales archaeon]|nr:phenylalanine--tRNA ligase subunit alpha [Candidatus Norongarragalinales archaeon]
MNELEHRVLRALADGTGFISGEQISEEAEVGYSSLMSILSKLSEEEKIELKRLERQVAELTPEGESYSKSALPERKLANALKNGPLEFGQIAASAHLSPAEAQIALQWAKRNGWIEIGKKEGKTQVALSSGAPKSEEEKLLATLASGRAEFKSTPPFENLRSRRLISILDEKIFEAKIAPAGKMALSAPQAQSLSQLTPQMMKDGSWKDAKFREYELRSIMQPSTVPSGKKHFYLQFIRNLKEQLVSLGFQEAEGPFTELEFWNMDALFMPQDHPARDIHDVFHLDLGNGDLPPIKIVNSVTAAHEKGVAGSKGWGYSWSPEMASRIVLRSQTTTVSARMLSSGIKPPLKIFCIGKVFRPDEIDWKHFIEFNQCEGIVVDENMSFRELLGYLRTFAVDIFGAKPADVRFAPSYFPFVEPAVEMVVRINGKWTEVGGAGIFRPEMTLPLGCKAPVLAWGLGLDRLAMIKLGLKDIRDLFSQDIKFLRGK